MIKLPALLTFLFIPGIANLLSAQETFNADQMAISRLLENQAASWNRGDIKEFMTGYTTDASLQFLSVSGFTEGWDNTLARYEQRYPDIEAMGSLEFKLDRITRRTSDIYTVLGSYHLTRATLSELNGYFLLVVQKFGDDWKIVADSTH